MPDSYPYPTYSVHAWVSDPHADNGARSILLGEYYCDKYDRAIQMYEQTKIGQKVFCWFGPVLSVSLDRDDGSIFETIREKDEFHDYTY